MNRIQRSIDAVLSGKLQIEQQPNYCLKAGRQVIEDANGWANGEWYKRVGIWSHCTPLNKQRSPTVAVGAEHGTGVHRPQVDGAGQAGASG